MSATKGTKPPATAKPKRAGILETVKDASGRTYYRGKVRLADGSLGRVQIPEPKCYSETAARNFLAYAQEHEDETQTIYKGRLAGQAKREASTPGAAGETCDVWYERFKAHRRHEVASVDDDSWRWDKWISRAMVRGGSVRFGALPIRDVRADDVEDVRDQLTAAVLAYEAAGCTKGEGRLAPKTAQNVWAALTIAMKYASTRKGPRELRVREDLGNPCQDMPPPRDGSSKRRHWLRPDHFAKLAACKRVPSEWREAYAVGLYLHLRPGELHELRVSDLDLVAGEVRICRAFDERTKTVTTPKTDEGIRTVTIPPTLLPLLERIARGRTATDRVCPVVAATPEKERAKIYREHLQTADVDHAPFYVETATHLMIDFRSLRDSGITWRFLAGHRAEVVQREAGHEHISTTLGYAKEVQDRGGRYGTPFPALPQDLAGGPPPGGSDHLAIHARPNRRKPLSGRRDLNPRRQAPKACALPDCATPRWKRG